MTNPDTTTGSARRLTIPAGVFPSRAISRIQRPPVVEPLPKGKTSTFPRTVSPRQSCSGSVTRPVAGSIPCEKENASEETSALPLATPLWTHRPQRTNDRLLLISAKLLRPQRHTVAQRSVADAKMGGRSRQGAGVLRRVCRNARPSPGSWNVAEETVPTEQTDTSLIE